MRDRTPCQALQSPLWKTSIGTGTSQGVDRVWTGILCASSAVLCVVCLIGCTRVARTVQENSASLEAEVRLNASRVRSLTESHTLTVEELQNLANRVKMQRVRNATDHATRKSGPAGDMPDPYTAPDEWRAAMTKRLAEAKIAGGKR